MVEWERRWNQSTAMKKEAPLLYLISTQFAILLYLI